MRFEAILFDAGGVLVVPDPIVLGPIIAAHGGDPTPSTLVRAHFAGAYGLDHADPDAPDWVAYHRCYAEAAGVPPDRLDEAASAQFATVEHAHWREPFPGAADALRALHAREVPIGVVSNAGGQIEQMLIDEGICQVAPGGGGAPVLCVVDSHVVGVAKPDPAIFAHALPLIGLEASERIAYVGDTVLYDVRAATAAGLTPLLHDPYGFHARGPHHTLAALDELLTMV
jgi:putative hydrolase of the HAD superfamily